MADDNPTLAKRHCQRRAVMGWVAGKNEISGGWQDFEAKSDQSAAQPLTAFDHASTGLLKIGLILRERLVRHYQHPGPRLCTPRTDTMRIGIQRFYERYAQRMTPVQRAEFGRNMRRLWGIDERGQLV